MSLSVGDRLGPYEILSQIGVGGMGEVYKARDTRLDRIVAIKISHQRFSERFEREARVVAALNHPNICQLYDVGPDFLVMEFVEGVAIQPVDTPRRSLDLSAAFLKILDEFRQRYLISYSPTGVSKNGWHRLDVRVKGRRVTVKSRAGYQAGA